MMTALWGPYAIPKTSFHNEGPSGVFSQAAAPETNFHDEGLVPARCSGDKLLRLFRNKGRSSEARGGPAWRPHRGDCSEARGGPAWRTHRGTVQKQGPIFQSKGRYSLAPT
jgi:hypothetical protein